MQISSEVFAKMDIPIVLLHCNLRGGGGENKSLMHESGKHSKQKVNHSH